MEIDSDVYNKVNGAQLRDAKETMQRILDQVKDPIDIMVDIGCGSGNVTLMLWNTIPCNKLYACDIDADIVKYAQENHSNDGKIKYFVQDISLPWEKLDPELKKLEGQVQLAWSNRALHWVTDKPTAVNNIGKLLKPGGHCFVNTTHIRDTHEFFPAVEKEKNKDKLINMQSFKDQDKEWRDCFNAVLGQVDIKFVKKFWDYSDPKLLHAMMAVVPAFLKRYLPKNISQEKADEILKYHIELNKRSIVVEFGKEPPKEYNDDTSHYHYEQFQIIGTK